MIRLIKGWFGIKEEPVVENNQIAKDSVDELGAIIDRAKAEADVLECENNVKQKAAKVAADALSLTGFYSRNKNTQVILQHNGVISVASAQLIYYAKSYPVAKEILTGSPDATVYLEKIFVGEVDRLMAEAGYIPVDARQIFHVTPGIHFNIHAVRFSSTVSSMEIELERNYAKEGTNLILKGISEYKQDFEAAKMHLMRKQFTDRFRPVIKCLTDIYLKSITELPATNYNPLDRNGLLTAPIDKHFEDVGMNTDLSFGHFCYTTDRFEIDYYLDDQDEEFIHKVHDPRAVVTFLWEALDPIVKEGKLNVSATARRDGYTRYTISISF